MSNIHVKVYVTKKVRTTPISVVYGSTGVGIDMEIMDYDLPAGSTAEARATGNFASAIYKNPCAVNGNTITMYPETGFFVPGGNEFQVVITAAGKNILSFVMDAICEKDLGEGNDPATPEQVIPLVQRAENAATQSEAAAARADDVKASIPADYTELSDGVNQLTDDLDNLGNKFEFYSNLVDVDSKENGHYYANVGGKIQKSVGTPNNFIVPPIKIVKNKTYSLRRLTATTNCLVGDSSGNFISRLAEHPSYTSYVQGGETIYQVTPTVDGYLYMTYNGDLNYSTITIVLGNMPPKYVPFGYVYRVTCNGKSIDGYDHIDITVGTGKDYNSLTTALSWVLDGTEDFQTNIILDDGTWPLSSENTTPDYCNIIGASGNRDKCIIIYTPTNPSDYDVAAYSAFRWNKNHGLKNVHLQARNCRYAIHSDSSNVEKDWKQWLDNCIIEHLINTHGSWTSQNAWGGGASSGCVVEANECKFIAHAPTSFAFSVHNNTNFEKPFRHYFNNCDFFSDKYGSFKCEGLISGTDDRVYMDGCTFNMPIYMVNALSIKCEINGSTHVQANSTNYFAENSIPIYKEHTIFLKNKTGATIPKGTIVAFANDITLCRPMLKTDDAKLCAGFTIGDTEDGSTATVITDGWYRYIDDLTFGIEYGVDNGALSASESNKIGICTGGGFVHIRGNI